MSTASGALGAVYDRGYRPYEGPRGGGGRRRFALYRASIRRALGIRRSWRQKVLPLVLLAHRDRSRRSSTSASAT